MAHEAEFNLRISVESEEELERITEAVYSGLAVQLIKLGVLYGQVPLAGIAAGAVMSPPPTSVQSTSASASLPELKPVETVVHRDRKVEDTPKQEKAKPKGLAGRKRMGRL